MRLSPTNRVWIAAGLALGLALAVWAWSLAGDRWPPAALLVFGPRWLTAVPVLLLVPFAARSCRPALLPLAAALGVVFGPLMGFCLPTAAAEGGPGPTLRVLSCNTDGRHLDRRAFGMLIAETTPDLIALQEWSAELGRPELGPLDWQEIVGPEGLYLASRFPVYSRGDLHGTAFGGPGGVARYAVDAPWGRFEFVNVHLASPRAGLEEFVHGGHGFEPLRDNLALREAQSSTADGWLGPTAGRVVAGDFNMPSDSAVFARHWAGYVDCFARAGTGWGFTKHTRWFGVRIDHVLAGAGWRCRRCWVGPPVGSDHRPLLADLVWAPPGGAGD